MKTTALDFTEIDAGMLADVGGKAANLGELTRAGLPVPPGWVLTTDAYRQVAQDLRIDGGKTGEEGLAGRARRHLMEAPVPDAVHEAIVKAYEALGPDVPVAVRSSATAEDLPFASFAGQQDTFLNVVGTKAVVEAVRRCWASLWTDRAVAYRESNGIDHAAVRLAVVVQRMVDARVAGVMFTANPVTGTRRESVIDASPGLGEAVVSGAVNPDRFRVRDGRILERHAGDKRLAIRSLPGGGTERVETAGQGLCLTDDEVRDLAALGARVEAHYGAPQDTEWAIGHDGTLWLTQARPITTLYPLPEHPRPGLRVYFSVNVVQGVMGPLTPMGQAAFRLISAGGAGLAGHAPADPLDGAGFVTVSGERLWLDITAAVRSRPGRAVLPRMLRLGEARAVGVMEQLFEDPRLSATPGSVRPFLRGLGRFARNLRLPHRVLTALTRPDQAVAATVKLGEVLDGRLRVPATATPAQRLDHAERVLRGTFPLIISIMPNVITGYALFALASRLSGVPVPEMSDVLRSLPHNPTTEMDLELWRLSTRIEPAPFKELSVPELVARYQEGRLPPVAQREIAAFLGEYGHRGVAEIDLGVPRWSEEPAHILGVLANYLRMEQGTPPSDTFREGAEIAQRAIAGVTARARRRGRWRAAVVRFGLGRTRRYAGLRELPKFYLVKTLAEVRASLLVVGEHLVGLGVLDSAHDVFFLDLRETRAALAGGDLRVTGGASAGGGLRELVAERRATYERERRRRHVPRVLLSDGTEPEATQEAAADGALTGTAASPGTVTGVARVVLDPIGAHLEPGEILVCPSTDPGWTPLFLTAGGLVMEMGGAMSHGAVVAREYGIPAVVGVPDATHRITSGQEITVNGAAGNVTISEP
ncbi:phosphoenolpyruvate synthase [Nonomuraea sp. PA05]|uniref:PEP/pyruvate-binding domain-containing protein n=1 Tax=Nonomuraea sp. PA05 TaxID=2604466 RepID=UPI0011DC2AAB|nr:PEP/pyruvate-binding domain-containing protein [Nonomuraea sp. PA05]TYB68518.1 phosphoenolpyruvate synthase [Nonomuraea sp. PA05]